MINLKIILHLLFLIVLSDYKNSHLIYMTTHIITNILLLMLSMNTK